MWSSRLLDLSVRLRGERGDVSVFNPVLLQLYHRLRVSTDADTRTERVDGDATYLHQLRAFEAAVRTGAPAATAARMASTPEWK